MIYQLICLTAAVGIFTGCAVKQVPLVNQWPDDIPLQATTSAVPFYPQEQYQCGPSALAMVLTWSGVTVTPDQVASQVFTPSMQGSLQPAMIAGARRNNRLAYEIQAKEALFREIAGGHPVIVLQNLGLSWFPVWHYAVVTGYDAPAGEMTLHSGASANRRMSLKLFEKTWSRSGHWGMLVLPPDRLPETATEAAFINAALGLEKAGRIPGALIAYQTSLQKWPQNFIALMGMGNSHYALGNLVRALDAFKETTRLHPTAADAFNNLAQVQFELNDLRSAEKSARRAVALGGPHAEIYLQTLKEIQSGGEKP